MCKGKTGAMNKQGRCSHRNASSILNANPKAFCTGNHQGDTALSGYDPAASGIRKKADHLSQGDRPEPAGWRHAQNAPAAHWGEF